MTEETPMLLPSDFECPFSNPYALTLHVNDALGNSFARISNLNEGKLF